MLDAQDFAGQKVELYLLEQFLIAAAETLLQPRHANKYTDGGGGMTALLALGEQGLNNSSSTLDV